MDNNITHPEFSQSLSPLSRAQEGGGCLHKARLPGQLTIVNSKLTETLNGPHHQSIRHMTTLHDSNTTYYNFGVTVRDKLPSILQNLHRLQRSKLEQQAQTQLRVQMGAGQDLGDTRSISIV